MRCSARFPLIWLALGASSVLAQGVYRHVGPDGRVTFSDQPPAQASPVAPAGSGPSSVAGAELPFALRQTTQRYPVTLYTAASCAPCDQGRDLLRARGIPFRERTVASNEDLDAFQKLSGSSQLPHLTLGPQSLQGFAPDQWHQYLDAAGYPKQSVLPRNYRAPAPTALAPATPATAASAPPPPPAASEPAPQPAPATPATGPSPQNPAGIRF